MRCVLGISLVLLMSLPAAADPSGVWRDKDGGTIRVTTCSAGMCAEIATMNPPNDPQTGRPWLDKNNGEAAKRSRPLIGMPVLMDMRPSGPGRWSGKLYDPDRGSIFDGNLIELGPDKIRIEGCVISLCGGEELIRVGRYGERRKGNRFSKTTQ